MSDPNKGGAKLHRSAVIPVQTGMSSIEYVIILILLTAIAVGVWKTFGENAELDDGVSLAPTQDTHRPRLEPSVESCRRGATGQHMPQHGVAAMHS